MGSDGYIIIVQLMNQAESIALLRAKVPPPYSGQFEEDERSLVQALEYIPLAIT